MALKQKSKYLNEEIMKLYLSLICSFMFFSGIFAESLSLDQCISLAKSNNKNHQANQYQLQSAEWQKKNAMTLFLPKATFNETFVKLDKEQTVFPGIQNDFFEIPEIKSSDKNYTSEINVNQVLFSGGKLYQNYKIAQLNLQQNKNLFRLSEKEIEWKTAEYYFQILKLNDLKHVLQNSMSSYQKHYEKANLKYKAGTSLLNEVLQWKVKLDEAKADLTMLQNSIDIVNQLWMQHLGLSNDKDLITPVNTDSALVLSEIKSICSADSINQFKFLENQIKRFSQTSLHLKNLRINKEMIKSNEKLIKSEFMPTLALNFNYQFENDDQLNLRDTENWKFIASLSIPLFNSGSTYTQYKMKKYELKQQETLLSNYEEQLSIQVKRVMLDLFDLAQKISSKQSNLELAIENKRQISHLYDQGLSTYHDLSDAETLYLSIQSAYLNDIYDYQIKKYEIKQYCEE